MFRSFIAKTRPSRGSLLRSGDRSFRVAVAAPISRSSPSVTSLSRWFMGYRNESSAAASVSSSQAPPLAEKFKYQAESSGKQTISLADDDFHWEVMRNFVLGGFALVGMTFYYVKGYVLMKNANQDYLVEVAQIEQQIEQQQAIKQIEQQQAIKQIELLQQAMKQIEQQQAIKEQAKAT